MYFIFFSVSIFPGAGFSTNVRGRDDHGKEMLPLGLEFPISACQISSALFIGTMTIFTLCTVLEEVQGTTKILTQI
jgi:hypothetical protein